MTPLARLLAAVEAGSAKRADFWAAFPVRGLDSLYWPATAAFDGDVTAAISLCEAMLPGYTWTICKDMGARIWDDPEYPPEGESNNPDRARALLIAVLRALVAMEVAT